MEFLGIIAWPITVGFIVWVVNQRIKQYLDLQNPIAKQQYEELSQRLTTLQRDVNSLSLQNGLNNFSR